ncbi:TfoX/Sxy family protein [Spongiivirga citrea]|uniref:TfoX/Sxy family protein n=1 Tax=Spongiivirga citrea TaxID=1481457 RepID=UPI001EF85E99|nr:TfoX/Sxy family protein [Spongiivirga citrea]
MAFIFYIVSIVLTYPTYKIIMAYNEFLADRIRRFFQDQKSNFYEKKMMGGLCFMVDDKMCCGIHFDKKKTNGSFNGAHWRRC